jgi:hypothetical protein
MIWDLEAQVNNGGFIQYYDNTSGDTAYFAMEALRSVGAEQMCAIVEQAHTVFGQPKPSKNRRERQVQCSSPERSGASPAGPA